MTYTVLSKDELLARFRELGITQQHFDPHAMDAVGTCHYHTIKDDVIAGGYSFDHFIDAYTRMFKSNKLKSIHDIRSFASWLHLMERSGRTVDKEVTSWSKDVAYFAEAEQSLA